jgi:putative hemolysin
LLGILRIKSVEEGKLTEEDIKLVLQEGSESGLLEPIESTILTRGSALDSISVRRLMTHRPDIAWLDAEKGAEENFAILREKELSMYPGCRRTPDSILRFVHARELLLNGYGLGNPDFEPLCKPLPYVPEPLSALRLLERFKEDHVGMALVLDEYGTVDGLVTLNDVLEALVGDVASVIDPKD